MKNELHFCWTIFWGNALQRQDCEGKITSTEIKGSGCEPDFGTNAVWRCASVCLSLGLSFLLCILSSWIRQTLRNFLVLSFSDSVLAGIMSSILVPLSPTQTWYSTRNKISTKQMLIKYTDKWIRYEIMIRTPQLPQMHEIRRDLRIERDP